MDLAILSAARFAIREPFAGGMEAHTHALAEGLTQRGHKVTVYAADGDGQFDVHRMLPVDFRPSDHARRDVAALPNDVIAEHHSYLEAIVHLASSHHQLVHLNSVHHLPFACTSLLQAPVTATLHSPPTPWLESAVTIARRRRNPPRLTSVSRSNAAAWAAVGVDHVIENGVDLNVWRAGEGGEGAVWTGRIVPEKAPHLAIEACRRAGVPLRIMGPIHDVAYYDDFIAPRLGPDTTYLGHGTAADVADVVGRSSVAVVTPTWQEPFGLVVAEALACGTPVAAFACGALPDLVDADTGVLAPADDVEALSAALLQAATLDRATCRSRAEARYSSHGMIDAYDQWFAAVVD
ncbi:MAG: glycosyltransferase [Ilumatobacteraceae bacterium]